MRLPILTMFLVNAAAFVLLQHTPVGRYIYAIGGNEEAVRLSGVRAPRYKLFVYGISGLTAAVAGLLLTSRLMSGQPNAGVSFELDAIAAVVLGGAAITGGQGGHPRHIGRRYASRRSEQRSEPYECLAVCPDRDQRWDHIAGDIHEPQTSWQMTFCAEWG